MQASEKVRRIIAEMSNLGSKAWHGVRDRRGTEIPQKKKVPELEDPLFVYGRRNINILTHTHTHTYIYIYIYIYTNIYIYTHTHTHTHTHTQDRSWHVDQRANSYRIGDRGFQELPRTLKKEEAKSACTHITLQSNTFSLY